MSTLQALRPSVATLQVVTAPAIYRGSFAFGNRRAALAALAALPAARSPNIARRFMRGGARTNARGHYTSVRTFDRSLLSSAPSEIRSGAGIMHDEITVRADTALQHGGQWRARLTSDEMDNIFGSGHPFGDVDIEITSVGLPKHESPGEVKPPNGDSDPERFYVMSVAEHIPGATEEIEPGVFFPTRDRIETTVAALTGTDRGMTGVGVRSAIERPIGFKAETAEIDAIDLPGLLGSLSPQIPTHMIDTGAAASALYAGGQWHYELGPVAPQLSDAILLDMIPVSASEGAGSIPIVLGLRLRGMQPHVAGAAELGHHRSGLLYVSSNPSSEEERAVELLIIPMGGVAFGGDMATMVNAVATVAIEKLR